MTVGFGENSVNSAYTRQMMMTMTDIEAETGITTIAIEFITTGTVTENMTIAKSVTRKKRINDKH